MFGLPADVNLSILNGATLIQVCVGVNDVILNFDEEISIAVASSIRAVSSSGESRAADSTKEFGSTALQYLGHVVAEASGKQDGTTRLQGRTGGTVDILDSRQECESYTIRYGDELLVV